MVTDEELSRAIESLFNDDNANPNPRAFTTLNSVVQDLESKLGLDLSHKVDFIRAQIHLLFRSHPPPPPPPRDHFALHQNPNFHPGPSPVSSAFQSFSAQPLPQPPAKPEPDAVAVAEVPTVRFVSLLLFDNFDFFCRFLFGYRENRGKRKENGTSRTVFYGDFMFGNILNSPSKTR